MPVPAHESTTRWATRWLARSSTYEGEEPRQAEWLVVVQLARYQHGAQSRVDVVRSSAPSRVVVRSCAPTPIVVETRRRRTTSQMARHGCRVHLAPSPSTCAVERLRRT